MRMVFPTTTSRLINDLASDVNVLVESFLGDEGEQPRRGFSPLMDVIESDEGFEFGIDLPGVNPAEIQIDIEGDQVTIHGARTEQDEAKPGTRRLSERVFGEFRRVLRVPETVDPDKIAADYEHGVLTLRLPKAAKPEPRRIVVSHGDATDGQAG